jgi:hypothetical protein
VFASSGGMLLLAGTGAGLFAQEVELLDFLRGERAVADAYVVEVAKFKNRADAFRYRGGRHAYAVRRERQTVPGAAHRLKAPDALKRSMQFMRSQTPVERVLLE